MRITRAYCEQLTDGLFHLMAELGIWLGKTKAPRKPILSEDAEDVSYLNAATAGIFVPQVKHWEMLKKGAKLGSILDPLEGRVLDEILSPVDGLLFTIREYPVVDAGSLVGRILKESVLQKNDKYAGHR